VVTIDQFMSRLARGKPLPAIVLQGTDAYLRNLCRNKIVETFVPENVRDWGVFRLSARTCDWEEILARAQMLPLGCTQQVLIVDEADSVEKLGDETRDEITESVTSYLNSPAPFTVLVLEADNLDGRQKFTRLLNEKAFVVELTIGGESAAAVAAEMAKSLGTQIEPRAAALLADILNGEPARMHIELEKLASYTQDSGRITAKDVEELVVAARKNTVWQFADMIASRRRDVALAFLDNLLREGEQPPAIVGALAWMYRKLIEARELPAATQGFQAARRLGMRPESAATALRQAHRMSKKDLLAGLAALAEADNALKSGNSSPRAVLEFLIAQLTPAASAATAARRS
jgi:DNA polymerase III subunit delta